MADRERIQTGSDSRFVRRDERGRFKESDDVGRSLSADRRTPAKTTAATPSPKREAATSWVVDASCGKNVRLHNSTESTRRISRGCPRR